MRRSARPRPPADADDAALPLDGGKSLWTARVAARSTIGAGQPIELAVQTSNLQFFDSDTGLSIGHPQARDYMTIEDKITTDESARPRGLHWHMTFVPYDRPVRAAFVGLGRIYDLNVRGYLDNPDVEVVALVDPDEDRREQRQKDWPEAKTFASAAELAGQRPRSRRGRVPAAGPAARRRGSRAARLRLAREPAEADVQRPARGPADAGRRPGERPGAAGDGELPVLLRRCASSRRSPAPARSARSSATT